MLLPIAKTLTLRSIASAITLFACATNVIAQDIPGNPPGQNIASFSSFLTSREMWLSLFVLLFGLCIIIVQYLLLRSVVDRYVSEIFKIFTVTLIIIGTLLLIISGFSSQQIAPALGLFGTIAGYILARANLKTERDDLSQTKGKERGVQS
jgi:hypothetical protein